MQEILSLLLMSFASLATFFVIQRSESFPSGWVARLKKLSSPLEKANPVILFFGFLIYITGMLWVLLKLFQSNIGVVQWIYIFSITNVSFTALSLWLDQYWKNHIVFISLKLIASIILGLSWVYYPEWFVYNTVGVLGVVAFVSVFPRLDFWRMYAIGLAIVIYDILGVYILGWIVDLVRGFTFVPPAVMMIPTSIAENPQIVIIGLGDIIIGALLLKMAKNYNSVDIAAVAYLVSISLAYTLAITSQAPVPATIFICPIMLVAIWLKNKKHLVLKTVQ